MFAIKIILDNFAACYGSHFILVSTVMLFEINDITKMIQNKKQTGNIKALNPY